MSDEERDRLRAVYRKWAAWAAPGLPMPWEVEPVPPEPHPVGMVARPATRAPVEEVEPWGTIVYH